jgi:hypothetical protein
MNFKSFFYLISSGMFFFFWWGLLPKFNEIRPSYYTAGLILLVLGLIELVEYRTNK